MYTVVFKCWMFSFEGQWLFLYLWRSSWWPREKYISIFDTKNMHFSPPFLACESPDPVLRWNQCGSTTLGVFIPANFYSLLSVSNIHFFMSFYLLSQSYKTIISCTSLVDPYPQMKCCGSASLVWSGSESSFTADPDAIFHFNTDPDPASNQSDENLRPLVYRPSRAPF